MHILDVTLMHILAVLIRMHILEVLLLLLATTVIAPLFWGLHCCNIGASALACLPCIFVYIYVYIYFPPRGGWWVDFPGTTLPTERREACLERSDEVRDYNLHITQTNDCP